LERTRCANIAASLRRYDHWLVTCCFRLFTINPFMPPINAKKWCVRRFYFCDRFGTCRPTLKLYSSFSQKHLHVHKVTSRLVFFVYLH